MAPWQKKTIFLRLPKFDGTFEGQDASDLKNLKFERRFAGTKKSPRGSASSATASRSIPSCSRSCSSDGPSEQEQAPFELTGL